MSFKEMSAAVVLLGVVVVAFYVFREAIDNPAGSLPEVAGRLLWAIAASIVFNIVANIVSAILISIAQGQELKDEQADERDHAVAAKAMRNAYVVASLGCVVALFSWSHGHDPSIGVYLMYGGLMLAGAVDAASRLVYYRIG